MSIPSKNKKRFDQLNITEWQQHVTGKGIKVGILGYEAGSHHNGADLINQVAPDVEIIEYGVYQGNMTWEQAFKQMLFDKVDVVCCSLRKNSWPIELEYYSKQLYENDVIMIDSSDNENEEIDAWPAMSEYWFVSGSYNEKNQDRYGYSNYGLKLDFLSYTDYYSKNYKGNYIPISHTSGTPQVPCGIVALLKEYWNKFGPKEFKQFIELNCIDLQEEGKDLETGWGLLSMPSFPQEDVYNVNNPTEIILHHSATKDGEVKDFDAIRKYHIEVKKWREIGYNWIIEKVRNEWVILKGREETENGAHTKGKNSTSIGICVVGNYDVDELPEEALKLLVWLIKDVRSRWGNLAINSHNKYANKTCPGTKFPLEMVRELANQPDYLQNVSEWAKESWIKAKEKGINDGLGAKNPVTEEQLMVFFDRLGLLD